MGESSHAACYAGDDSGLAYEDDVDCAVARSGHSHAARAISCGHCCRGHDLHLGALRPQGCAVDRLARVQHVEEPQRISAL